MTKQEWRDDICDFGDLIDFCRGNGYDAWTYDYYDDSEYDDMVEEDISDRDCSCWDLRDYLAALPSSRRNRYYHRLGWMDYQELEDEDLQMVLDDLESELEEDGFFDEGQDETEEQSNPVAESDWWQSFTEAREPDPEPDFDKLDMTSFMKFCGEAAVTVRPVPA